VDFKKILNNKVEPRSLHKDWEKKTRFQQFDLSLPFFLYHNWSYRLNFEVISVVWKLGFHTFLTVHGTPSNSLKRERTIHLKLGFAAARQNAEITKLVLLN
jgi:hypothetical protein